MTQTTRTVNELISAAFYLIGEFDEEQTIPGTDFDRAFDLINLIVEHFSESASYTPLTSELTFNLVPNQRDYVFSNVTGIIPDVVSNRIASLQYCNIVQQQIWWPINIITRTPLYNNYYNLNVTFRPTYVLVIAGVQETTLRFFPAPNQVYQCQIQAKFYMDDFVPFQPIVNIPLSLQRYFIYALGRELTSYYPSANWSQTAEDTYQTMTQDLFNTNDLDITVRPSALIRSRAYNYNSSLVNIIGG